LSRKSFSQAEELLQKEIFGTRQIGVTGYVDTGERDDTLNSEHEPTRRADQSRMADE